MNFSKTIGALALSIAIISCSSDDDAMENLSNQTGELTVKFDNAVGNQDFIFDSSFSKSNGESFKLETLKYIVSNIKLTDENGVEFEYPTSDNIFIIDEANANNAGEIYVELDNVPAANYTKISFGIGVDQTRFAQGAAGQGDFLTTAQDAGMFWSWASGYKFMRLDGTYSDATVTDQPVNIHMGSVGTSLDNYREITLDLPNTSRVREDSHAEIHLVTDILQILDGASSLNFSDGYDQVHTNEIETPIIANNFMGSFSVDHIHN
ncbi:hypothetical protein LY01_01600 [Nonlabens xylanidelens]|uniref:Copper-binding protein MbnP-like domain-containing protein n=1 Tax=Nonlabens xylanidelens TaxID=191564 RepID=A0A2S6IKT7_9FLAO|nr:MbnP family protein [Nonlabens xylanidelens]PPK94847.1 hypothetical protein LY01_01600 [Nonlabens xylanidelens]PQJ17399.1 hypothetical protein BST94_10080 [Nonlabens xylanidelens]